MKRKKEQFITINIRTEDKELRQTLAVVRRLKHEVRELKKLGISKRKLNKLITIKMKEVKEDERTNIY